MNTRNRAFAVLLAVVISAAALATCTADEPRSSAEDRASAIERYEQWLASGSCTCENADIAEQLFGYNLMRMQECCHRKYCASRMNKEKALCSASP